MSGDAIDLRSFERIVFFTGAGLSVESGIPTYRGKDGVWRKYNYEDYACQRAFDRDPEKVWEFHEARRAAAADCRPNAAHEIIAAIQAAKADTDIVTQNIDGLHQRAGAKRVMELHGSLWRLRVDALGISEENFEIPLRSRRHESGAYWRPDIVWFEDPLPRKLLEDAVARIAACDCLVSVGTSAVVYPAAQLPLIALENGATLIEINPQDTPLSRFYTHHLRGPATEMMRLLWPET